MRRWRFGEVVPVAGGEEFDALGGAEEFDATVWRKFWSRRREAGAPLMPMETVIFLNCRKWKSNRRSAAWRGFVVAE